MASEFIPDGVVYFDEDEEVQDDGAAGRSLVRVVGNGLVPVVGPWMGVPRGAPSSEFWPLFVEERDLYRAGDTWRKCRVRWLYERWFAARCAEGKPPDRSRRYAGE